MITIIILPPNGKHFSCLLYTSGNVVVINHLSDCLSHFVSGRNGYRAVVLELNRKRLSFDNADKTARQKIKNHGFQHILF